MAPRERGGILPDLHRYQLVVFDLDGTLYAQGRVRLGMALDLIWAPTGPDGLGRLARLRVLSRFRRLREALADTSPSGFEAPLFARLVAETGLDEPTLRALTTEWMERRPLERLRASRVAGAHELFSILHARGIKIAIWSDYPVHDKLAALGLQADLIACAGDPEVGALKPDPAGLVRVMELAGVAASQTLMIGDRVDRDGAAARTLKVDFLLRAARGPCGLPRVHDFRGLAAALHAGGP